MSKHAETPINWNRTTYVLPEDGQTVLVYCPDLHQKIDLHVFTNARKVQFSKLVSHWAPEPILPESKQVETWEEWTKEAFK